MKHFWRIMLLVFIVGIIAACGNEEKLPDNESVDSENTQNNVEDEKIDMDGYECVIIQARYPINDPFNYKENTLYSELALNRIKELEDKYNCTITLQASEPDDAYLRSLIPKIATGEHFAEMAFINQSAYLAYGDVLYPLTELKDIIDYENSEKFGSKGLLEMGMKNSVPYTVYPVMWPEKQGTYSYCMFVVNENLIKQNNLTDPREYVENKTWTWATFEKSLEDYTIDEGENKVKAVLTNGMLSQEAAISNGFTSIIEVDGVPTSGIYSDNFSEAINWAVKLSNVYKDSFYRFSNYDQGVNAFLNNEGVLYHTSFAHMFLSIVYEMYDYGVVPFPCGPRQTYGVWAGGLAGLDGLCIFNSAKEPELAATILNDLFEPFPGFETKEKLIQNANSLFFDQRDTEFYFSHIDNLAYNYWTTDINSFWSSTEKAIKRSMSAVEIVETHGSKFDSAFNEYIVGNYDYLKTH